MRTEAITVQHIQGIKKAIPDGFQAVRGVSIEWRANIVLDITSDSYDTITIKKGDKELTLPWGELAKLLGMDW